jgi:hypothetical protein
MGFGDHFKKFFFWLSFACWSLAFRLNIAHLLLPAIFRVLLLLIIAVSSVGTCSGPLFCWSTSSSGQVPVQDVLCLVSLLLLFRLSDSSVSSSSASAADVPVGASPFGCVIFLSSCSFLCASSASASWHNSSIYSLSSSCSSLT